MFFEGFLSGEYLLVPEALSPIHRFYPLVVE
jgi:hypothetical protein